MNDDVVERLLADELPNDGQWEREARMVLHSLLKEAADEIQQNRVDLEEYRRDTEHMKSLLVRLFEFLDLTEESDSGNIFHPITITSRRADKQQPLEDLLVEMKKSKDVFRSEGY